MDGNNGACQPNGPIVLFHMIICAYILRNFPLTFSAVTSWLGGGVDVKESSIDQMPITCVLPITRHENTSHHNSDTFKEEIW